MQALELKLISRCLGRFNRNASTLALNAQSSRMRKRDLESRETKMFIFVIKKVDAASRFRPVPNQGTLLAEIISQFSTSNCLHF